MAYTDHFRLVDDVSAHFDGVMMDIDPYLQSKYAGFYAVTSAAVLELALKEIVIAFAQGNHALFGEYVSARYERINGRISLDNILEEHLKPFGSNFRNLFRDQMKQLEEVTLRDEGVSLRSAYGNLLTCRHSFAHEGAIPTNATYDEVKRGFEAGKVVMTCLSEVLRAA